MHIITIYTIEAHPVGAVSPYSNKEWTAACSRDKAGNPVGQPVSYQERLTHAKKTIDELGITVPVLIDEFDNPVWCTYGPAPNIAYLIARDGTIVEKQGWYNPTAMENAIGKTITTK
jgi:hypothetical protein